MPNFYSKHIEAPCSFEDLRKLPFEQRQITIMGTTYDVPRLTQWYGEMPYIYSGQTWVARPLPELLQSLLRLVEAETGASFNSVLLNLYRDGSDSVAWHSDDEPLFGPDPEVASLTFGATRTFKLRSKAHKYDVQKFELGDGDLLYMGKGIQGAWEHAIGKTKKSVGERINLTFRKTLQ